MENREAAPIIPGAHTAVLGYKLTVSASPSAGGTVSGGGTFVPGGSHTVTATAKSGYIFSNWTENGSAVSSLARYSFTLTNNRTLFANFRDMARPTLAITNLAKNQQWGSASVPIKGWAKDNAQVTNVQYRLGSGEWFNALGTTQWSGTVTGLVAGAANTLSAFAQDSSGLCSLTNVVQVVYNQFLLVNGTYNGLFSASNALYSASNRMHESSGFLKLTVSGKGSYSGSLLLAGKSISLKTRQFDANGRDSQTVVLSPANAVVLNLALNLTPGSDTLTGTLSNSAWVADLRADRAVFSKTNAAPYAGKFTLIFPGAEQDNDTTTPLGLGYGAVTVDSLGNVVLGGSLADGTVLSQVRVYPRTVGGRCMRGCTVARVQCGAGCSSRTIRRWTCGEGRQAGSSRHSRRRSIIRWGSPTFWRRRVRCMWRRSTRRHGWWI